MQLEIKVNDNPVGIWQKCHSFCFHFFSVYFPIQNSVERWIWSSEVKHGWFGFRMELELAMAEWAAGDMKKMILTRLACSFTDLLEDEESVNLTEAHLAIPDRARNVACGIPDMEEIFWGQLDGYENW